MIRPFRSIVLHVRSIHQTLRGQNADGVRQLESSHGAKRVLTRFLRTAYIAFPLPYRTKLWLKNCLFGMWMRLRHVGRPAARTIANSTSQRFVDTLYSTGRFPWERAD